MPNESEKQFDPRRAVESTDEQPRTDATIKDLSPNEAEASEVRGGLEPPNGRPGAYLVPPST